MADIDFDYYLGRKYAILQQQADAGTVQSNASANAANAAASLDAARALTVPAESAANVGQTRANTKLLGQQAAWLGPQAQAQIAQQGAQTGLIKSQTVGQRLANVDAFNMNVQTFQPTGSALGSVMGSSMPTLGSGVPIYRTSDVLPARRSNEGDAAYLDRINGL